MFKQLFAAAALVSLAAVPGAADAKPCRAANGKFEKCAEKKAVPAKRCRNAKGQFAKCGTPGAKPA